MDFPQTPTTIVATWLRDGFDMMGHGDGDAWYPCRHDDIPRGASGVYHDLRSPATAALLAEGLADGWSY